jgi:hypothetical protein
MLRQHGHLTCSHQDLSVAFLDWEACVTRVDLDQGHGPRIPAEQVL